MSFLLSSDVNSGRCIRVSRGHAEHRPGGETIHRIEGKYTDTVRMYIPPSQLGLSFPLSHLLICCSSFSQSLGLGHEVSPILVSKVLQVAHCLSPHLTLEFTVNCLAGHAFASFLDKLQLIDVGKSLLEATEPVDDACLQSIKCLG